MVGIRKIKRSAEDAMWAERAKKAREILTSRGHNYAIIVRKRLGIPANDTAMANKIFNVAHGKSIDERITLEMEQIERLSRVMLPMDDLCEVKREGENAI